MKEPFVSDHARERWVQRIANPERFAHIDECGKPNCNRCYEMKAEIKNISLFARRGIQAAILECYRQSVLKSDPNFAKAIRKRYSETEVQQMAFFAKNKIILVVSKNSRESAPIIRTILTEDMLDETVIRTLNKDELKSAFVSWKNEVRTRNNGKIPTL